MPEPAIQADREPNGRFRKGCAPGPGRPPKTTEESRLAALMAGCSDEDVTAAARALVAIVADEGEATPNRIRAAEVLFKHVLPPPTARHEISLDRSDQGELRLAGSWPSEVDCQMLEQADRALAAAGLLGDVGALSVEDVELHLGLSASLLRQIEQQRQHDRQMAARYGMDSPNNEPQLSAPFQRLIDQRIQRESRLDPAGLIANRHATK